MFLLRKTTKLKVENSAQTTFRFSPVRYTELGLEQAPFVVLVYFSSSFEHAKKPAYYGPQQH